MRILFATCVAAVLAVVLGPAHGASAQDRAARAEIECLMLSDMPGTAVAGEESRALSYDHVWIPGLRYGRFESNGRELVYEMEGGGDDVLLVVPGGPGLPHNYFHPALSSLSRYATLVYFDRRADYLSKRPPHAMLSPGEMAADIEALRKALGEERVTLVAHSFGGAIALTYALEYPERIERLILVSTSAEIENPSAYESRFFDRLSRVEREMLLSSEGDGGGSTPCERVRRMYRALYPHYFHKPPAGEDFYRGIYSVYFDSLARKQLVAGDGGFDVRNRLAGIGAPVLVVGGRHDILTPVSHAVELAEGLPKSKLVVMEHSGHFPFYEENFLFTEWVRQFLAATPKGGNNTASAPASDAGVAGR